MEAYLTQTTGKGEGMVEPYREIPGLLLASSLHRPRGIKITVRLVNTGTNALTVKTGALIGQYSPVTEVESLPEEKDGTRLNRPKEGRPLELPAHLRPHQRQWSAHL